MKFTLMKFTLSRSIIAISFLLIIPLLQGFSTTIQNNQENCLIVLAIAYKDVYFDSGNEKIKFQEPVAYQYMYTERTNSYKDVSAYVKKLLIDKYKVSEKEIVIYSEKKSKSVLIQYQKEYKAYNKTLVKFAFGFGNTEVEAEANAVIQKNTDVTEQVPYLKIETVGCTK